MYKIIKNIVYILTIATMLFSTACSDVFDEVKVLKTDRLFRPIGFEYTLNKTKVTLNWAAVIGAESYTLQISTDADFNNLVVDETLTKTTFEKELAGDTEYYARIKANAVNEAENSQFIFYFDF